ncbi:MAG TPA: hypothetical protein VNM90_06355 [Haliangium sp.]|nr:hypothetical protein [Haliangium sp.]
MDNVLGMVLVIGTVEPGSQSRSPMPTMTHQALASLFRDKPKLGMYLFEASTKEPLPIGATVESYTTQFTDLHPPEYSADAAYLIKNGDDVQDAVVVEVQLAPKPEKRASWLQYVATAHRKLLRPVTVMVLAVTEEMARWCEEAYGYDRVGNTFRPLVIGPSAIPRITDLEQAKALPELAVLSVAAHGHEPDAEKIGIPAALACETLDSPFGPRYADCIYEWLNQSARRALEEHYMKTHHYEFQSEWARRAAAEGRKEGLKEGQQKVLSKLLGRKFGELPDWAQQRLRAASDADIERWIERVLVAGTLDDVFAD